MMCGAVSDFAFLHCVWYTALWCVLEKQGDNLQSLAQTPVQDKDYCAEHKLYSRQDKEKEKVGVEGRDKRFF